MATRRSGEFELMDAEYLLLAEFRRRLREFLAFSEAQARAVELEPQHHQLLLAIKGLGVAGPPTVRQLADWMLLRHHSAVELIDRLEARGLVRREPSSEDRRAVVVQLTARGAARLRRLSLAHREELRETGPALVAALEALFAGARPARRKAARRG